MTSEYKEIALTLWGGIPTDVKWAMDTSIYKEVEATRQMVKKNLEFMDKIRQVNEFTNAVRTAFKKPNLTPKQAGDLLTKTFKENEELKARYELLKHT